MSIPRLKSTASFAFLFVSALVIFATPAVHAGEGKVSGSLTVGDAVLKPTRAVAIHTRWTGYQARDVIKIYLGTNSIDLEAAYVALDVDDAIRNQLQGDYVIVTLEPDGSLANVYAFVEDGYQNFGFGTGGHIEWAESADLAADRIAARIFTKEQQMLMETPFEFDLTVSTTVAAKRTPKSNLAKDGGEPGRAYSAYVEAARASDAETLKLHGSSSLRQELEDASDEMRAYSLESLAELAPQKVEVTGGELFDGFAILTVKGKDWSGDDVAGQVKMIFDGKTWRLDEENLEYAW